MKTTRHKATSCPTCGHKLDASSHADAAPSVKDFSICFECGEILQYEADFTLVAASKEELAEIERKDPGFHQELMAMQRQWDERDEDSRVPN
jgi:uncharacterized protein with PIN domain